MLRILFKFKMLLLVSLLNSLLVAQHIPSNERGDVNFRRHSNLDGNNVRTTIHNFGWTGTLGNTGDQWAYEWPKNTGRIHLAIASIWIGGEVTDGDGEIIQIVEFPALRTNPQGDSWNFEPVPGYFNSETNELASSDYSDTWPSFWPDRMNDQSDPGWIGSWDGYLGKNVFIDGEEIYCKFSDDNYNKHNYYPDTTDYTRGGLGLLVKARAMAFTEDILEDVIFLHYEIKNDGTKPLTKLAVTTWLADIVGGDANDDLAGLDLNNELIWMYDADDTGGEPWGDDPVGLVGVSLLKTPQNIDGSGECGLQSVVEDPAFNINFSNVQDSYIWNKFMQPGYFYMPGAIGEYDRYLATGYFSLEPGESTEIMTAVFMANGETMDEKLTALYHKLDMARGAYTGAFNFDSVDITLNNPLPGEVLSDLANVSWTLSPDAGEAVSYIYHSNNNGNDWELIFIDSTNTRQFDWDTETVNNGVLHKLKIYSFTENGIGFIENSSSFSIYNPGNGDEPEIIIVEPVLNDTVQGLDTIMWIGGNPGGDPYTVNLYYRTFHEENWDVLQSNVTENEIPWDSELFPNSEMFQLKGEIITASDTGIYVSDSFTVFNERQCPDTSVMDVSQQTKGTGSVGVHITDPEQLTGEDYIVEFKRSYGEIPYPWDETYIAPLYYNIRNRLTHQLLHENVLVNNNSEGPLFDGLRLQIYDDPIEYIEDASGWNNPDVFNIDFSPIMYVSLYGEKRPADYKMVFGEVGFSTSKDTTIWMPFNPIPAKDVNFKIFNITDLREVEFAFSENHGDDGVFSVDTTNSDYTDVIYFLEPDSSGNLTYTYMLTLESLPVGSRLPDIGDTLFIYQRKPFQNGDKIYFNTEGPLPVKEQDNILRNYSLSPNFPNPFNPATRINYTIPQRSKVNISIFNVLGQKIKTLINRHQEPGNYQIDWKPENQSSGIYFIKMEAGRFFKTHKMIYLK